MALYSSVPLTLQSTFSAPSSWDPVCPSGHAGKVAPPTEAIRRNDRRDDRDAGPTAAEAGAVQGVGPSGRGAPGKLSDRKSATPVSADALVALRGIKTNTDRFAGGTCTRSGFSLCPNTALFVFWVLEGCLTATSPRTEPPYIENT